MYKCASCGRQFLGGERIDNNHLWQQYTAGKQTYQQLGLQYGFSIKTIQRKIDKVRVEKPTLAKAAVVVLMDTTYFGRGFGVMLFKDAYSGKNPLQAIRQERDQWPVRGSLLFLKESGLDIKAIVCDGRKGLLSLMPTVPKQMCQFHQVAIVTRYLTRKPKMQAAKELREHTLLLSQTDKESFEGGLAAWHTKWEAFLNERSRDKAGKNRYTHRKLRSAYRSLKTNMPWLFTWYENIEINIPNTTNAIDGHFADMKNKLRNHNGLSLKRKMKFIDEFLKA